MKINYLVKSIPFLSTLLVIFFLVISNQKQNANLKILIWKTPTLSVGKYLALSMGSGFILSFLVTNNIAKFHTNQSNDLLKYKVNNNDEDYEDIDSNEFTPYEKTLIERDFKDPSPTLVADFRVIGKIEKSNTNFKDNINYTKSSNSDSTNKKQYYEKQDQEIDKFNNQEKSISLDWNDESFLNW